MTEAPLITRALRLASLILIVTTVALVASVGYSGFQEFQAISGTFSSLSSSGGNNSTNIFNFNGSSLTISGLDIPNNMTYPLDLQLSGAVGLAGTSIGTFATPMYHIMPGETEPISYSFDLSDLNFSTALSNQSALTSLLFSQTSLTFRLEISASIVPILGLNVSTSSLSLTIPALLGNLNFTPQTPSCSAQGCSFPVGVTWNNPSQISFNGGLTVAVTNIPGYSGGSLPSVSLPLKVQANSPGDVTPTLFFSSNQLQYLQPGQQIGLGITFSAFGVNATIPESVTVP